MAGVEAAERGELCQGPLDRPAVPAEPLIGFDAAPRAGLQRETGRDRTPFRPAPAAVAAVADPPCGSASARGFPGRFCGRPWHSADRRGRIDRRDGLAAAMHVGAGQVRSRRLAPAVDDAAAPSSGFACRPPIKSVAGSAGRMLGLPSMGPGLTVNRA